MKSRGTAVFFDKDGTLIEDVPYNVDPDRIVPMAGAEEALQLLAAYGYKLFIVTNQSGVAHGRFSERELALVADRLRSLFETWGVRLGGFYYCPHHPQGNVAKYAIECSCRKPRPGLIHLAAREQHLDLARSWFVGDILHDVEAGLNSGCRSILIDNGHETEWVWSPRRVPNFFARDLLEAAQFILEEDGDANSGGVLERA